MQLLSLMKKHKSSVLKAVSALLVVAAVVILVLALARPRVAAVPSSFSEDAPELPVAHPKPVISHRATSKKATPPEASLSIVPGDSGALVTFIGAGKGTYLDQNLGFSYNAPATVTVTPGTDGTSYYQVSVPNASGRPETITYHARAVPPSPCSGVVSHFQSVDGRSFAYCDSADGSDRSYTYTLAGKEVIITIPGFTTMDNALIDVGSVRFR